MLKLIIPDSGPLILLARINRLDVLGQFKWPIVITDAVKTELFDGLNDEQIVDSPHSRELLILKDWFKNHEENIQIHETTVGYLLNSNIEAINKYPEEDENPDLIKEMIKTGSDISIWELGDSLHYELTGDDSFLVLFENTHIPELPYKNHLHFISIWSFIKALENIDMISSCNVLDDVKSFIKEKTISKGQENPIKLPFKTMNYLKDWSQGKISSIKAIDGLGIYVFRELLDMTLQAGLSLPCGKEDITRQEIEDVIPVLKKQLEFAEKRKEKNHDQPDGNEKQLPEESTEFFRII